MIDMIDTAHKNAIIAKFFSAKQIVMKIAQCCAKILRLETPYYTTVEEYQKITILDTNIDPNLKNLEICLKQNIYFLLLIQP